MKGRNLEVVGAKGFEPSTSWSRTRESKILKPCRCRTYGPSGSQNLFPVGPHGTRARSLTVELHANSSEEAVVPKKLVTEETGEIDLPG
jgi:hypothetical protein